MTSETPTAALPPTADPAAAPAAAETTGATYGVLSLVLSILSIPLGTGILAIAGIVLGVLGRRREPAAVTTANWGIVIGLVSLFGWLVFGVAGFVIFAPWAFTAWAWDGF
jgi:hypothetical protein